FVGYVLVLVLGYEIFSRGMDSNRISGSIIGLVGLFLIADTLASVKFLPASIQETFGMIAASGIGLIVLFLLLLAGAAAVIIYTVPKIPSP
ncbi:MAG: hypothetical protein ABEK12_01780, partial [Candidatus Nanohaloarchaea archaeon]